MKFCPKCDFSFASFHHVCDFDGTDLVDAPETLPVSPGISALVAATQPPYLRLIKSPVFLAVLALAGLLSSALLIGYFDAASQPNSFAQSQASRDSVVSLVPPVQTPVQPPAQVETIAPSFIRSEISKPAKDLSATRKRSVRASRYVIGRAVIAGRRVSAALGQKRRGQAGDFCDSKLLLLR